MLYSIIPTSKSISRLFDELDAMYSPISRMPMSFPVTLRANVYETQDEVVYELAVPGMGKDDFQIEVSRDYLTVRGEKKQEKKERPSYREFTYAQFERSFHLPEGLNIDKAEAHSENGILTIRIPKVEEAKPKLIPIR